MNGNECIRSAVPCSQNVTENEDFLEHPKKVLPFCYAPIAGSIQNSVILDKAY
jgi:hypothetical protein